MNAQVASGNPVEKFAFYVIDYREGKLMLGRFTRFGREISELQKERIKLAKQTQGHDVTSFHDPIEDNPLYQGFLKAAESDTDGALRSADRSIAFLHRFWETKQRILIRKYGIIWFSPEDMNPSILFD